MIIIQPELLFPNNPLFATINRSNPSLVLLVVGTCIGHVFIQEVFLGVKQCLGVDESGWLVHHDGNPQQ